MKAIVLSFLFLISTGYSQTDTLKTTAVSIFKNGTGFFIRSGMVLPQNSVFQLSTLPLTAFGTLWFSSLTSKINSVQSLQVKKCKPLKATTMKDFLSANLNKTIKITIQQGTNPVSYEGIIHQVIDDHLVMNTQNKFIAIKLYNITQYEFTTQPQSYCIDTCTEKAIEITFENNGSQQLNAFYLSANIGWTPNYLIELLSDDKARLTLQTDLINDAENLTNAEINFVVGVPNFMFNHAQAPLTSSLQVKQLLESLYPSQNYGNRSRRDNMMNNAVQTYNNYTNAGDFGTDNDEISPVEIGALGSSEEELFYYTLKNINLPKNARATFQILQTELPYQNQYTADLSTNSESSSYYFNQKGSQSNNGASDPSQTTRVWRSILFENKTPLPWTTASALIAKNTQNQIKPIAQDLLSYTPPNGKASVKLTVASDVAVQHTEYEVEREENKKNSDGYHYDLVTVEAKISLKNYKNKPIVLNLNRNVIGEMKESSTNWTVNKKMDMYKIMNKTNQVQWQINLNPNDNQTITYKYQIYIRH